MNLHELSETIHNLEKQKEVLKINLNKGKLRLLELKNELSIFEADKVIQIWSDKELKNEAIRKATLKLATEADPSVVSVMAKIEVEEKYIFNAEIELDRIRKQVQFHKRIFSIEVNKVDESLLMNRPAKAERFRI